MAPNSDHFPGFTFTFHRITFAERGPDGFTFLTPGLRIIACCRPPRRDVFVIDTDDSIAGIEELINHLDPNKAPPNDTLCNTFAGT